MFKAALPSQTEYDYWNEMSINLIEPWGCPPFAFHIDIPKPLQNIGDEAVDCFKNEGQMS